jgi:hypothetical protein
VAPDQTPNPTHAVLVRHPWALVAMLSAAAGLNAMRHTEQCLTALDSTKMTAKQKLTLLAMVDDFVTRLALHSAAKMEVDIKFATAQLKSGAFPQLAEVFGGGKIDANKDRFERGVLAILDAAEKGQ